MKRYSILFVIICLVLSVVSVKADIAAISPDGRGFLYLLLEDMGKPSLQEDDLFTPETLIEFLEQYGYPDLRFNELFEPEVLEFYRFYIESSFQSPPFSDSTEDSLVSKGSSEILASWDEADNPIKLSEIVINKAISQDYTWIYYILHSVQDITKNRNTNLSDHYYQTSEFFMKDAKNRPYNLININDFAFHFESKLIHGSIPYVIERVIESEKFGIPLKKGLGDDKRFIVRYMIEDLYGIELIGSYHGTENSIPLTTHMSEYPKFMYKEHQYYTTIDDYLRARGDCVLDSVKLILFSPFEGSKYEDTELLLYEAPMLTNDNVK